MGANGRRKRKGACVCFLSGGLRLVRGQSEARHHTGARTIMADYFMSLCKYCTSETVPITLPHLQDTMLQKCGWFWVLKKGVGFGILLFPST